MIILSIETSCDETAISILEISGEKKSPKFKILANNILSQINIHKEYGGVYPMLAKREHSKNLMPIFLKSLREAKLLNKTKSQTLNPKQIKNLKTKILNREPELLEQFLKFVPAIKKPKIDRIAVTYGPGLEPALWVGVNFAKALSASWNIPIIPVNHMLGHFFSAFIPEKTETSKEVRLNPIRYPALALLVSGGHTELIFSKKPMSFKKIGETRDDAAGEAFDKVARLLGLPYPGGPEISKLATEARRKNQEFGGAPQGDGPRTEQFSSKKIAYPEKLGFSVKLPRPMINSKDFDFSFSGLKTAVLYLTQKIGKLTPKIKQEIAREFEDAAVEVLVSKTLRAAEKHKVETLIVAGGVAANRRLREVFEAAAKPGFAVKFPTRDLATDNSLMIALAGYFQSLKKKPKKYPALKPKGNLSL